MILATATGFEPIPSESKSDVLPLHYAALTSPLFFGKMCLGVNSFFKEHTNLFLLADCIVRIRILLDGVSGMSMVQSFFIF